MDKQHPYVFVNDDCEACQYIHHAFRLLNLPLSAISAETLLQNSKQLTHVDALFMCPHVEKSQPNLLKYLIKNYQRLSLVLLVEVPRPNLISTRFLHHLPYPFNINEIKQTLVHCQQHHDFIPDAITHKVFNKLIGESKEMRHLKSLIMQVAQSDSTVLILGQSGTGKDVIASCIHNLSNRCDNPLVPINCGAIPTELMESELFGHEKGAFTGAHTRRPGRFEMANTGTLFLDEIGDMPLPMQVKLLRVIQDRIVERVGGNASIKVDVRLISATNKDLSKLIRENSFREDLYYRLNVFPIHVPSLSERPEDIPSLIEYHLDKIYKRLNHRVQFTEQTLKILSNYPWPGNIRELENFLERMVIIHGDAVLDENKIDNFYKKKTLAAKESAAAC